jgi:hypothetical protein
LARGLGVHSTGKKSLKRKYMNLTSAKREGGWGWKRKATKVVVSDGIMESIKSMVVLVKQVLEKNAYFTKRSGKKD